MRRFGLTKKQIHFIKDSIQHHLPAVRTSDIWVFGSRATGTQKRQSDVDVLISPISTPPQSKIDDLKDYFEESDFPYKVDLVSESELSPAYRKAVESQKTPLMTPPRHPWRLCPPGEYWRSTHVQSTYSRRDGATVRAHPRRGSCCKRPSGKDQLYPDEIHEISKRHFRSLKRMPCELPLGFKNGSLYDSEIAGWTQYWNDVLQPEDPLDPNLVKALIASESGFRSQLLAVKRNRNSARGLMQVLNSTRMILADEAGEIRDHLVNASRDDLNDPSTNICAGIRWLFHKRHLTTHRLGRPATWIEAVADYKGLTKGNSARNKELLDRFLRRYEELKQCKS
jgi:predicted nucleotidyltransferase